jgi:hypothetical protein
MFVRIPLSSLSRRLKTALAATALAIMIFYVLPVLLAFFWQFTQPGPKIREQQIQEKPLRVISSYVEII